MRRKVRMGMIGGGKDAFIGAVHRMAANLDGEVELVCGVFSRDEKKSKASAEELNIAPERCYPNFEAMFQKEKNLSASERMEFVTIVTPNNLHYVPAKLALENGFHVLCEKPLAFSVEEAQRLEKIVLERKLLFGLMHNYTAYPMIKEARQMIKDGKLGKIRKVVAEYLQGWLSNDIEAQGQKQASWRTDPAQAGISCCVTDIGTHAENILEYITGLKITELAADISTFVPGRKLDDDANILLRMENGAKGVLFASQIATGEENELKIRIYGEKAGLEWMQSEPNSLVLKFSDQAKQIIRTGNSYLSSIASTHSRLPSGHPEGYIESMANVYRNFAKAVKTGKEDYSFDFPGVSEGVRGMKFIQAVVDSSKNNSSWIKL